MNLTDLLKALMADSKVAPLNYSLFRITFSQVVFRETKQKQLTNNIQKKGLFFSVCVHLMSYGKIFFPFVPWFLNAANLSGTFS